ncbi:hypothetical protein SELMODRAFT_177278 [Selaginella moellendorffii]|uniref:Purple acid phosphatase n=1 Tax=Selaginella moellendorffii TaxID=88036 RepID=D8S6N1_SELML|nr:hypothetical protein SELMODRAFT_177278 [Selaginella moellendorffii]
MVLLSRPWWTIFVVFLALLSPAKSLAKLRTIPSTADGPFDPVTVALDERLPIGSDDLPNDDPRLAKIVPGFHPEQIALAQGTDSSSMFVSWITGEFQVGQDVTPLNPSLIKSVVEYGIFKLDHFAVGKASVYSQLYPYKGLNNYTSGIIHHVKLQGLKPSTTYYYRCGDPFAKAMSPVYSFTTLPAKGPYFYPKRIAIVGDLGLTYNTTSTICHLQRNKPDLNVFVGDLSYANLYVTNGTGSSCYKCAFPETPIHETYQPRWDYWGRQVYLQSLRSKVPTMVIEGNHEYELQAQNNTFVAYNARFAVPYRESGSPTKMYYSFNAGGAHFIMLGGYIDYSNSSQQYAWLEKDLMSVDREETPWLIVAFHQPWYNSYKSHYREAECMRQSMEDLLYKFGVDIVFSGHVHAYERMNLVYNYEYDRCAPLFITVGDGGNREGMAIKHADDPGACPKPESTPDPVGVPYEYCGFNFTSGPAAGKFCWDRQPDWSAFRDSSFGHGILEIESPTRALWTWHRNQDTYLSENHVGDQIYIVRRPEVCPNRKSHDILAV